MQFMNCSPLIALVPTRTTQWGLGLAEALGWGGSRQGVHLGWLQKALWMKSKLGFSVAPRDGPLPQTGALID